MSTTLLCERLHQLTDQFLDNELNCDESIVFTRHMNECSDLAALIASRKALRERMREVVGFTATAPPGLETKIRARLTQSNTPRFFGWPALALAATVLLAVVLGSSWRSGGLRFTVGSQQDYINSLLPAVSPVMRVGLQQHVHCAFFRKIPSPSPTLEELAREIGPNDADLLPVMQSHLPPAFHIVLAHLCTYQGRPYVHLAATDGSHLISLLIAKRAQGEAFENDLRAVAAESDIPVYTSSAQRFGIAGFETRDHLIYLVSDLDPGKNLSAFGEMVPDVARMIRTHEI